MPKHPLLSAFTNFLQQYKLVTPGEKILAAVSGGIDSMVLLDILNKLKGELHLEIAVAHFNHRLRSAESDEDEQFVQAAAARYGVEYYVERAHTLSVSETTKRSVQETARDLRYAFFKKLRTSLGFQKIATAHHADDNAETVLFNLFRGAGLQGLSGITAYRKDISVIRPLLFASREEIREYAAGEKIEHREDSSNAHPEYTRNFLRQQVIPVIRENINPNLIATLNRTSDVFEQVEHYVQGEAASVLAEIVARRSSNEIVLNLSVLQEKPLFLQEYIFRSIARELISRDLEYSTVRGILSACNNDTGTSVSLARDAVCYRNRKELIFRNRYAVHPYRHPVQLEKEYDFEYFHFGSSKVAKAEFSKDPHTEFVDGRSLGSGLALRTWKDGDAFVPLGMKEKKKVSDFFVDEKIPLFEKHLVPILVSEENIVWICGKRLDDRYKITDGTTTIIRLEYHPLT